MMETEGIEERKERFCFNKYLWKRGKRPTAPAFAQGTRRNERRNKWKQGVPMKKRKRARIPDV